MMTTTQLRTCHADVAFKGAFLQTVTGEAAVAVSFVADGAAWLAAEHARTAVRVVVDVQESCPKQEEVMEG